MSCIEKLRTILAIAPAVSDDSFLLRLQHPILAVIAMLTHLGFKQRHHELHFVLYNRCPIDVTVLSF